MNKPGFNLEEWMIANPVASGGLMGAVTDLAGAKGRQAGLEQAIAQTQYSPWLKTGPGDISPYAENTGFNKVLQGVTAGMIDKKNRDYEAAMLKKLDDMGKSVFKAQNNAVQPIQSEAPMQAAQGTPSIYAPIRPEDTYVHRNASADLANSEDIVGKVFMDMSGRGVRNPYGPDYVAPKQPARGMGSPYMMGGYHPYGGGR